MKDVIIARLAQHGWKKDRIVDAFTKTIKTATAPKQASFWLKLDRENGCWYLLDGNFTSAGDNVLATSFASFPPGMQQAEIEQAVDVFVTDTDRRIATAYSVRLLRTA